MFGGRPLAGHQTIFFNTKEPIMRIYLSLILLFVSSSMMGQKRPLDHSVYDGWRSVSSPQLTPDGKFSVFEVNPQEGDGKLVIHRNADGSELTIPRGYKASIAADGLSVTALIKSPFSKILAARKKNVKKDKMPQDSVAFILLPDMKLSKWGTVKGYKTGLTSQPFLAYVMGDATKKDYVTTAKKASKDKSTSKKSGKPDDDGKLLIVVNTATGQCDTLKHVAEYAFSPDASRLAVLVNPEKKKPAEMAKSKRDTTATKQPVEGSATLYDLKHGFKATVLSQKKAWYGSPKFSVDGNQLVFLASTDTASTGDKHCSLFWDNGHGAKEIIPQGYHHHLPEGWTLNQNSAPEFSRSGRRILVGVAPLLPPRDTTIFASETAQVDIWNWRDEQIQPQQKVELERNRKYTYPAIISLDRPHDLVPLTTQRWDDITLMNEGDGEWALSQDRTPYYIHSQWEDNDNTDVYLVNTKDGSRRTVAKKLNARVMASPDGNYLLWYQMNDSAWYVYDIKSAATRCLTRKVATAFYDEEDDHPNFPPPYDLRPQWLAKDRAVIIADRYDLWQFNPIDGRALNLTAGQGRSRRWQLRHLSLDYRPLYDTKYWREKNVIGQGSRVYMTVFDEVSKKNGLASVIPSRPTSLAFVTPDTVSYQSIRKSRHASVFAFCKGNFRNAYDLYLADGSFTHQQSLTRLSSQLAPYSWGTAHLVHWKAFDGTPLDGILYIPDGVDLSKKYPMISYFYERRSESLYDFIEPRPSRSTVNLAFYCSRGYVVFVPDIRYQVGHPGESAYNCIVSGVKAMCAQYPFIDSTRLAIQGQSWGGYQTAYLVTRTPIFAAAGAGAPVSNMTSAYDGIRWASGVCRQMQYEHGQSRIGKSLWDKGGLDLYLENSPLFKADKVKTPLLIMHNDNDGAVPWYQGIEYFMALCRLGKPVWMLEYNKEAHNLVERRNCKDLSVRLQQFFDHYLLGAPEPAWMRLGVPAVRKGQYFGTELTR